MTAYDVFHVPPYTCGHMPEGICDGCLEARLDARIAATIPSDSELADAGFPAHQRHVLSGVANAWCSGCFMTRSWHDQFHVGEDMANPDCPWCFITRSWHDQFHVGEDMANPDCPYCVPAALRAPECSNCKALSWTVDHFEGDSDSPLLCSDCADQAYDRG